MINPIMTIREVILMMLFSGISLSSVVINCDTKTELKKIATNREDPRTTDRVTGK